MLQQVADRATIGLYINIDASVEVKSHRRVKCSKMDVQMEKTNWET
jgi:hypothetical protein